MNIKSLLFSKAIENAKNGNVSEARKLLSEIEKILSDRKQFPTEWRLLDAIRKTYNIYDIPCKVEYPIFRDADNIKSGISVVSCCMNRTENLLKALPTWIEHKNINEIIIIDWSSDQEVRHALLDSGIKDKRIRVIRVIDEPRWILSYAFNLGFRCARYDRILKVDADIIIKPDFFERNKLVPGAFIAGNWEVAAKGQEHINGFFYIFRQDLLNVKGFNEYITTYGWDDDDLYTRLKEFGLKRICVDVDSIYHIPHDDAERLGSNDNEARNALEELHSNPLFKIRANRYLAMVMPHWKAGRQFAPFEILEDSGDYIQVRRKKNEMPHYVNHDIKRDAEYYSALELISWKVGPQIYHLSRSDFFELLMSRKFDEINAESISKLLSKITGDPANEDADIVKPAPFFIQTPKPKLYIDCQHGLGNRLRAIASAACIADKSERELVIVWQPDHHSDCRFHELFDYKGPVIEESFIARAYEEGMSVFNYMEIEEGAEKDAKIQVNGEGDVYVRSAYVLNSPLSNWEDENRFLRTLRPVAEVLEMIASVRTPNDVSVHVRMVGGKGYEHLAYEVAAGNWTEKAQQQIDCWRKKSHYSRFMGRIDTLIKEGRAERIFLAADNPEAYKEFTNRYGDRVAFLPRNIYDRSAYQLRYALADAFLLSRAPLLLGSTWSSFSELAIRLSEQKIMVEMSGKDF